MPIPLLPRLNEDKNVTITKRGEWTSDGQNTLANLIKDLKVTADADSDITSIPDLWARPAMYEMVLFNEKHHLHKKYLAQWRGILAMLAFREMRGFKSLKKEELLIPDVSKIADNEPSFLKVVASLLPDEYKNYKDETVDNGYKLQLLTYNDAPLAILWPTILVCPAIGLSSNMDRTVSWWNLNGIFDPISSLNEQEKGLLSQWIAGIIDQLPANDRKIDKLMGLLSKFRDDLATYEKASNYGLGTGIGITGFCKCIDRDIKCEIDSSQFLQTSNVKLINRRGTNAKTLLVLTTDMYKQWNKSASDIIVAGSFNLDSVLPYGGVIFNNSKLNDIDLSEFNAELRMGEDFFTDKICLIEGQKDLFPNALNNIKLEYEGTFYNVILPIRQKLLDYLAPEDIIKNFRMSVLEKGVKVELDLQLSGFNNEDGERITISKVYNSANEANDWDKEILNRVLQVPLIQLWPNFIPNKETDWQAYYSFCDNKGNGFTFSVKPLWTEYEESTLNFDNVKAEIVKGKTFPEGYSCFYEFDTPSGNKNVDLGLILLRKPKSLPFKANNNYKIGIDFGTTNSVAYYTINNMPARIELKNRLYLVTEIDAIGEAELRRHFLNVSDQPNGDSISIRTLFNPNFGESSVDMNQPIFPGAIYYLACMENLDDDYNATNVVQGYAMKWDTVNSTQSHGIEYAKWFLYQLALQCMAEAVVGGATHIDWYYSYPKAFNPDQIRIMSSAWPKILAFCQDVSPNISNNVVAISQTESAAMSEYFSDKKDATFNRGMICLDIGGGSTDIAIWQGQKQDKLKAQCSLIFAGNEILTKQLFKQREALHKLKNNDENFNKFLQILYDVPKNDYNKFSIQLEALLKYHEKELFASLMDRSGEAEIKKLTRNIAFALSGIFYYAGVLAGNLMVNGALDKMSSLPHCYVGGNGSKLLDWVDLGNYKAHPSFEDVYKICLAVGASNEFEDLDEGQVETCRVEQSDNPKGEVAYGLVCNNDIADTENNAASATEGTRRKFRRSRIEENEESVLAGEDIFVASERRINASITKDDVVNGIRISKDLPCFKDFLMYFNAEIKDRGYSGNYQVKFDNKDFEEIYDQTNEILAKQSMLAKDHLNLEPPFIIVLKQAMKLLN